MGLTAFLGSNFLLALLVGMLIKAAVLYIPTQMRQRLSSGALTAKGSGE